MSVKEEWKEVHFDNCKYKIEVSSLGHVRKTSEFGQISILTGTITSGFRYVSICGRPYAVHKMVAEAFVPNPEHYYKVVHKNGDKSDCRAENLVWAKHFIRKECNLAEAYRNKVFCLETDQVFGSLKTAAYTTGIPQDVISWSIANNTKVFGLSFIWVEPNSDIVKTHNATYISFDRICEFAKNSSSIKDLKHVAKECVSYDNKQE